MLKPVYAHRTMEQFVELARRHAPELSDELMVLLSEVFGDMRDMKEQLERPPQEADVGRVIAGLWVDSNTLARKSRQLAKLLDRLLKKIPDEVDWPIAQEPVNRTKKRKAA
jgi:hypothetical protein